MKNVFLTMLFLLCKDQAFSQYGVQISLFQPTENFGFIINKQVIPTLVYRQQFSSKFRTNASISFAHLNTRIDTFPVTAWSNIEGANFLPGYKTYKKFDQLLFNMGADYCFYEKEKIKPFIGLSLNAGLINEDYEEYIPMLSITSYSGGFFYGGINLRLGTEIKFSQRFNLNIEAERSYNLSSIPEYINYYCLSINVVYIIHKT